jgi:hypothetical protein
MNRLILKLLHVIIPLKHETDVIYETKVCPMIINTVPYSHI